MSSWISQIDIRDPLERYCTKKKNEVLDYDININEKHSPFDDLY
jgi:predicted N-acyltransferase